MKIIDELMRNLNGKKETEAEKIETERTEQEPGDEADRLAGEMANCYAEITETAISEESDDTIREILYGMYAKRNFVDFLGFLMVIFDLADKVEMAEIIRNMEPEYITKCGGWICSKIVYITEMDQTPTIELKMEDRKPAWMRKGEKQDG